MDYLPYIRGVGNCSGFNSHKGFKTYNAGPPVRMPEELLYVLAGR